MDDFEKSYNKALRFLSLRPRSEKEIKDNLLKKKVSQEIVEKIIEKLRQQHFVNDKDFAKMWVESRLRFRPRSLSLIKRELLQKGIDKEIIESILDNNDLESEKDLKSAKTLVVKRIAKYDGLSRQEIYQKLGNFLARRGFDWDTIKKSIDYAYEVTHS